MINYAGISQHLYNIGFASSARAMNDLIARVPVWTPADNPPADNESIVLVRTLSTESLAQWRVVRGAEVPAIKDAIEWMELRHPEAP